MSAQLTRADLVGMTPAAIVEAHEAGRCRQLLTGQEPQDTPTTGQLTREHLRSMSPAEIVEAHEAGRLAHLTGQEG